MDEGVAPEPRRQSASDDARKSASDQVIESLATLSENAISESTESLAPPLPPRPSVSKAGSVRLSSRPTATTALSLAGVHTQTNPEAGGLRSTPGSRSVSRKTSFTHFGRFVSNNDSDGDDSASLKSFVPTLDVHADSASILSGVEADDSISLFKGVEIQADIEDPFTLASSEVDALSEQIEHEFDDVTSGDVADSSDGAALVQWKAKLKHFIILSASGKPIYSRHGDDQLISHYVGVVQTIMSFYQGANDPLRSFSAGGTRFVILAKGPLNLLAISRLGESDAQLKTQLESLYMQILSTLTLPAMERMFSNRPSTDLRRPLQGTDVLLDGLADGFTRGSPSTLLSALECLRLRKTHRRVVNDTLLKVRTPNLLYGLIVAAGRLVSVVRPKKHSLHPGDLHLIFNMLFEAGSVKAGGGESWIPLCLPGFNNTGFLYMYVSFFSPGDVITSPSKKQDSAAPRPPSSQSSTGGEARHDDDLAIVLISANKEAFFELRSLRDTLLTQLAQNGSLAHLESAIRRGRPRCVDVLPANSPVRHFLYKSRANVQFVMPSFGPTFAGAVARRRLLTVYHRLHEGLHARGGGSGSGGGPHLTVQHLIATDYTALAWETPLFELYCVAGPKATRGELAMAANRIVQWIRREEERVFIIGGAVF